MNRSLALSPCPNDTFIFSHFLRTQGWTPYFHDVEELNQIALKEKRYTLTKLSFAAYFKLEEDYILLDAGGAMGRGCGPLLIVSPGQSLDSISAIVTPGSLTTARLLASAYLRSANRPVPLKNLRYDQIMPAVAVDPSLGGVIIHEDRFTYKERGLIELVDLGRWWEEETGQPIPLGCIALRRDCQDQKEDLEQRIRRSIEDGWQQEPDWSFIRSHAQSLSDEVIRAHIDLYVNTYSMDWGADGRRAIARLREGMPDEGPTGGT
ncbi:MAG: 1,4-dihydroxy-6-naphthoate synthase [Spirochaetales bacterium]|nr:1,4-dihydroxy-6-naphthoate synthase [Spirochaetales bacterium]